MRKRKPLMGINISSTVTLNMGSGFILFGKFIKDPSKGEVYFFVSAHIDEEVL